MQCQECFEQFVGMRCSCGWMAPGQLSNGMRTRQGMKLCSWVTAGRMCTQIASGDATYCNWHHEWERQLEGKPMKSELEALTEWMTQFQPGEMYGVNPGQWWADPKTTLQACHGLNELPARTERMKRECYERHWEAMKRLKRGIYSEKNQRVLAKGKAVEVEKVLENIA